ncbi:MAG: hypothetical protein ACYCQI_10950 [Gammaproteobacteria bacterium]
MFSPQKPAEKLIPKDSIVEAKIVVNEEKKPHPKTTPSFTVQRTEAKEPTDKIIATFTLQVTVTTDDKAETYTLLRDKQIESLLPTPLQKTQGNTESQQWHYRLTHLTSLDRSKIFFILMHCQLNEITTPYSGITYHFEQNLTVHHDLICFDIGKKEVTRIILDPYTYSFAGTDNIAHSWDNISRLDTYKLTLIKNEPDKVYISKPTDSRMMRETNSRIIDTSSWREEIIKSHLIINTIAVSPCKQYIAMLSYIGTGHLLTVYKNKAPWDLVAKHPLHVYARPTNIAFAPNCDLFIVTDIRAIRKLNMNNPSSLEIIGKETDGPNFPFQTCEFDEEGRLVVSSATQAIYYRFASVEAHMRMIAKKISQTLNEVTTPKIPLQLHSLFSGYIGSDLILSGNDANKMDMQDDKLAQLIDYIEPCQKKIRIA